MAYGKRALEKGKNDTEIGCEVPPDEAVAEENIRKHRNSSYNSLVARNLLFEAVLKDNLRHILHCHSLPNFGRKCCQGSIFIEDLRRYTTHKVDSRLSNIVDRAAADGPS